MGGGMTKETGRVIDTLLGHARNAYDEKKLHDLFKDIGRELDDPGYIQDKDLALLVCHMLICLNIEHGKVEKGSIAHKLGLRLYDYIDRMKEVV
jgi:hypothetical protein